MIAPYDFSHTIISNGTEKFNRVVTNAHIPFVLFDDGYL